MEPRATEHGRFVLSGTDDDDDDDAEEGFVAGLMTPHPRFPPRGLLQVLFFGVTQLQGWRAQALQSLTWTLDPWYRGHS